MYQINFHSPISVYFIGIGGISMSGLAEILQKEGFSVSGSDEKESALTRHLEQLGITIFHQHSAENLTNRPDLVVYTAAVKENNPEFMEAKHQQIPMLTRAQLLGQIMNNYSNSIGIAGTHGKTTTTSMISEIFLDNALDPTISVGGILDRINGNIHVGTSDYFITEACEYTNSFHSFYPKVGIILNICADHLDFFKDLEDIRNSFYRYAKNIPSDGTLILNSAIENWKTFVQGLDCSIITFGLEKDADYYAAHISYNKLGCPSYDLIIKGKKTVSITLNVLGEHNILNSLAACAAAHEMGISPEKIAEGLSSYHGTERRFQVKGIRDGVTIVDDYAHHPDEIQVTLKAAKNYPHNQIWCVFQPHTYTRTKALLKDFALSLSSADHIILTDIYPARETDTLGISSKNLQEELEKIGKKSFYFSSFEEIENFLIKNCIHDDLLITMGAGNVVNIGENLLKK